MRPNQPTVVPLRPVVRRPPSCEPPYDDERADPGLAVSGANALVLPLQWDPRAAPGPVTGRPPLTLVRGRTTAGHGEEPGAGPCGPPAGEHPAAAAWAQRLCAALVEVAAGFRPPGQLIRWTSHDVWRGLSARHAAAARQARPGRPAPTRPVLRRVHVLVQPGGQVEVVGRFSVGPRDRAVALRMEPTQGGWRCTALSIG